MPSAASLSVQLPSFNLTLIARISWSRCTSAILIWSQRGQQPCFSKKHLPGMLQHFGSPQFPCQTLSWKRALQDVSIRPFDARRFPVSNFWRVSRIRPHVTPWHRRTNANSDARVSVIEAVMPSGHGYAYTALTEAGVGSASAFQVLAEGWYATSPFINFRWMKAPGETYGRSPVMKALPDIKTANKVVELVLKNASIAVTGIWQADDDGVINPATIRLIPGAIIPKAVGSAGLTPLEAPGRFDVSELVLEQLRTRIRKALFVDQLGQVNGPRMTATEVLERTAEMARILGATYGRLQSELLSLLVTRARTILTRRGEIAELPSDHRLVSLEYKAPQARFQAQQSVQNALMWLEAVNRIGPDALSAVNQAAAARWLGKTLGVPDELIAWDANPAPQPETP